MKGSSLETQLKINERSIRENRFIFPFCQSIAFWELRPKGRRHQSKGRATIVFQSSSCLFALHATYNKTVYEAYKPPGLRITVEDISVLEAGLTV